MDLVRGPSHAVSQLSSSPPSQKSGQQLTKMPQSQPVQGIEPLPYSDTDRTLSTSSDKFLSSSSTVCTDTSRASALPYSGIERLHSPLEANDERLLGMPHLPTFSTWFS